MIASTLKCMYCLCLLFWGVPNFLVYTRSFLAVVFRHSPNGENFAVIRVGQQALQGSHPAPICLPSLPARYALGVGERCGEWLANQWHTIPPLRLRPHQRFLPSSSACLMCRFASFSRVKHLREVGPLSRPVMWSMQLTQPVSAPLQSSLRFLPDCCPHRHWSILRCTFPLLRGAVWIYPVPLE